MVLDHFDLCDDMSEVMADAMNRGAFDPERGWLHGQMVEVLQAFGLLAYRRNWRLLDGHEGEYLAGRCLTADARRELDVVRAEMTREGIRTVHDLLEADVPVTVSIYRPIGDRASIGHQVVLLAADQDEVIFHDPAHADGALSRCAHDEFFANWKGTAIIGDALLVPPSDGGQPQNMLNAL